MVLDMGYELMKGVIFIGLQASGKSSFFLENFYSTHLRLNLDMLRTRHREKILFNACLEAKQPCVIDNTNPAREDRFKYLNAFKSHRFGVDAYYFQSSLNDCIARNDLREGKAKIPKVGLIDTYNKLELPEYNEGFDRIYFVTLNNGKFFVEEQADEI